MSLKNYIIDAPTGDSGWLSHKLHINLWNDFFESIEIPDDVKSIYYAVDIIYGNFFTDYTIIPIIFLLTNHKIYKLQYKDKKTLQYTDIYLYSNPGRRNPSVKPVWIEKYVYEMNPYFDVLIQYTNKYISDSSDKETGSNIISPNTTFINKLMDAFNTLSHNPKPLHILNWNDIMKGMTDGLMNNTDNDAGKIKDHMEKYIKPLLVHLPHNELILDIYFIGNAINPKEPYWGCRSDPIGQIYIIGKNMIYEVFLESYKDDSISPFDIRLFINNFHSMLPYYRLIIKPTMSYSTSKRLLQFCQCTRNYAMISSGSNGEKAYKMVRDTFLTLVPLKDDYDLTESEINQMIERHIALKEEEYKNVMDDVRKATISIEVPICVGWLNRLESVSTRLIHRYQTQPFIDRIKARKSLTMEEFTDFGEEVIAYFEQQHQEWHSSFLYENSEWKRNYLDRFQEKRDLIELKEEQRDLKQCDLIDLQKEIDHYKEELTKKNKLIEKLLLHLYYKK